VRGFTEIVNLVRGRSIGNGGMTSISDELPMGEGWHELRLRFNLSVTIGTGSGFIVQGTLHYLRNIRFVTDKGEVICNLPGRALYAMNTYKYGAPPVLTALADATATYRVNLTIPFTEVAHLGFIRPEDTILDTKRYTSCKLEITTGTVSDMYGTVGTSSVATTLDIDVKRTKGLLPVKAQPIGYVEYDQLPPIDANSQTFVYLKRSQDLAIKRLYVGSVASGTAGVPWSGTLADDVQDLEYVEDQSGYIIKDRNHNMIQVHNKNFVSLESIITGVVVHDFVEGQSNQEALATVGKTLLQYRWTNQAGVGAGDLVSVAMENFRAIAPYGR
jgi:hypothetical protein